MAALATFTRFRLYFEASSDSAHESTRSQFEEDQLTTGTPAWGQYVQCIFEMQDGTGTFSARERGLFGIHWINTTGGALDLTWITADYTAVESAVSTMFAAMGGISSQCRLVEYRWYAFGPGVVKPNPPSRVTTLGTPIVGGNGNVVVHQVASTITLRTPLRRHWGRFYVPSMSNATGLSFGGQWSNATVDGLASSARTMLTAPSSQGVVPVVWDRVHSRAYGVTQIEADSVPDIIRRRRPRATNYKKIYTA
jgi:hypothetical protein